MKNSTCLSNKFYSISLFVFSFAFFNTNVAGQTPAFEWAGQLGGTGVEEGYSIATDASGNVYTTGYFQGTSDFDPGIGTYNLTSVGQTDIFISKVDIDGNFVWAKSIGSAYEEYAYAITIDGSGNVLTTGYFSGTADFDPNGGTFNLSAPVGNPDIFISKLNASGNFVWAKQIGGSDGADLGLSITTNAAGDIFTTGYYTGTVDFDPGATTFSMSSISTTNDVFISKLNAIGDFVWAKSMGGSGTEKAYGIDLDISGNVYLTGYFDGTGDYDPGVGTETLTISGATDFFFAKYDGNGDYVWAKSIGSTGNNFSLSVAIDGSGNTYLTGYFADILDFDPGVGNADLSAVPSYDIFLAKYDSNGDYLWVKPIEGGSNTGGTADNGKTIVLDASGNCYITGHFYNTADFDPGAGTAYLTSNGEYDVFCSKYDSNGDFIWAQSFGDFGYDTGEGVTVDNNKNVYLTGSFSGTVDFDPFAGTYNMTSGGSGDAFIFKLSQCDQTTSSQIITACDSYLSPSGLYSWITSGIYNDTIPNTAGCDSVITIDLTINYSNSGSEIMMQCGSYFWTANGTNYTSSGVYNATLINMAGCDSTATLILTILNESAGSVTVTACDSYFWPDNGATYTTSGVYVTPMINMVGCDSIVTLNLTINNSETNTNTISECDSYFWPADGMTYFSSGTYIANLLNDTGCDSIVTLDLTIGYDNTGYETITVCDSYFWPANSTTYNASGTYNTTLTNISGCDSVVTLDLTINNSNFELSTIAACESYFWPDNGVTYTNSGTYNTTLTNMYGCDSIVTLDLTINNSYASYQYVSACTFYYWNETASSYAVSGLYSVAYTGSNGCDSILYLDVTIGSAAAINFLFPSNEVCENGSPIILGDYVSPAGGFWSGDGIVDGNFEPLVAGVGTHTLTYNYYDGGCLSTDDFNMTVNSAPAVNVVSSTTSCGADNGTADATITGGTLPYDIYWTTGDTLEDISDLAAGMYFISVLDANGCVGNGLATITSTGLSLNASQTNLNCFGDDDGAIDLTISTSSTVQSIAWSNGETTEDISNLPAGFYEVIVTTTDGCTSPGSFEVQSPTLLTSTVSVVDATCGANNGSITCTVDGGTLPYSYQWYITISATPIGSNSPSLINIPANAYFVVITDGNGCSMAHNTVVSEIGAPQVDVTSIIPASCSNDGAIDVSINSSNVVTDILWSNGQTTEDISTLSPGYYYVIVTDEFGCMGMAEANVPGALPTVLPICVVTVDTLTNTNLIVWTKEVTTSISHYNIYRETSVAGQFLFLDSVLYANETKYNDTTAFPQIRSWRYKLTVVNTCGEESDYSELHKTIHLTISLGLGGTINLNWDDYEGFTFGTYDIYRYTNSTGWQLVIPMPSNLFSYLDTPPNMNGLDYIVSVSTPLTCTSSFDRAQDHNNSRSNKTSSITGPMTGVEENVETDFMSVYPNPSTGEFILNVNPETVSNYQVIITDATGRIVLQFSSNVSTTVFDLSGFADGVYNLQMLANDSVVNEKLVKQ